MKNTQQRVRALIRDVRSGWRRRVLVQGLALTLGVAAAWGIVLLLVRESVSPTLLLAGILLALATVAYLGFRFVARPMMRRIADRDVALFIEERMPGLEDRLNAAVEIDDADAARRAHGVLVDHLIDDTALHLRSLPIESVVVRKKERMLVAASAVTMLAFLVLGVRSLDDLRASMAAGMLLRVVEPEMTVDPGDAEIEQGASQPVVVTLREGSGGDVVIHYRSGDGAWSKASMQAAVGEPSFLHEFVDVQEPITYFVEHRDRRSDAFDISLYRFPAVEQIDLTYTFPDYTGRAPEREEDGGDISAVRGTTVTLDVATNGTAEAARLVLDGGRTIDLSAGEDGRFRGRLTLEEPGYYTIQLTDSEGKTNKFPEEYRIQPVDDLPPIVQVTIPQRDVRANSVEEVLVAARAEDDFGVRDFRLRFAVNGGEERTIELGERAEQRPLSVEGEHLFFLEDYPLAPGDVISYFVEAEDFSGRPAESSDMYFVEVIPFDQEYTQVAGGGGAAGGGQSGIVMSQQQIIAATWRLHRERHDMPADEFNSSIRSLAQAQNNLRLNIAQRISETAFSLELQRGEETRQIASSLREAVAAMERAVETLEDGELREAITPEREALNHLLKADFQNRQRQIALNRGGQPGGGGNAGATEERMTELMDLELDISKDKYEMTPQGSGGGASAEADEALRKLQELARRQENLARQSQNPLEGEDQRRQVERLQRDQREIQEQTEALSQRIQEMARQQSGASASSRQQMERATERMREAERALREGDVERARTQQQQALNEMERVAQDLQRASNGGQRQTAEEMSRAMDRVREQEERLTNDMRRTAEQAAGGRVSPSDLQRLADARRAVREEVDRLREQAEALSNGQNQDLAAAAREVQRAMQRRGLDEQLDESEQALRRGWLDSAIRRQEPIRQGMESLEEALRAFDEHLPGTEEENLARSLETLRELERELRALEQLAAGEGESGERGESPSGQQDGQQDAQGQTSANGRGARADAARREARMERIREQLSRLERELGDDQNARPLGGIRRALSRADNDRAPISPDEAKAFFNDQVFAPLSQLEEALVRQLDQIAMERKLRGSRPDEVPAEYRELVARYYEALSRER
ncbi:MAG TPA: DUF4175 family protein [Rhodothermales bacterium]